MNTRMKKKLTLLTSFSMGVTSLTGSLMPVIAYAEETPSSPVNVSISDTEVTLENDQIARTFAIDDGVLSTSSILNKRINRALIPQEGSKDFVISALVKGRVADDEIEIENRPVWNRPEALDRSGWTGTITNQEGSKDFVISALVKGRVADDEIEIENRPVWNRPEALDRSGWTGTITNKSGQSFDASSVATLFDGDLSTYPDEYRKSGNPFTLDIDLGSEQTISAFSVDKRPGYSDPVYGINGTMGAFEVLTSDDGENWTSVGEGEFTRDDYQLHQEGNLYNVGVTVHYNLPEAVTTSHVRIIQKSGALSDAEEFSSSEVNLYAEPWTQEITEPTEAIDRSNWTGTITNASGQAFPETDFPKLIDGNKNTNVDSYRLAGYPITIEADMHWTGTITNASGQAFPETDFPKLIDGNKNTNVDSYRLAGYPITIEADMQEVKTISSFSLDKRPGFGDPVYGVNGTTGKYEFYTSMDGENWELSGMGNFVREAWGLHQEGNLHNVGNTVYANLNKPVECRYIRLVQLSDALGSTQEMSLAEINVYADEYSGPDWRTNNLPDRKVAIANDDLTFIGAESADTEEGKKLTLHFAPIDIDGVNWTIDQVFVLNENDSYMRAFLEIDCDNHEQGAIDYIDQDALVLSDADMETVWSHPDASTISTSAVAPHEFLLGQPIYAGGLFMGSEFPASETQMNDDVMQIRYYSGKTFDRMEEDNQLTTDGKFISWQTVVGSARGTTKAEVQSDFYDYIEDIATPTSFRKQYNSWYDNMMTITDESIEKSFVQTEDGLARWGIEPLDAYVVDDGWNNYYDGEYLTSPGADRGTVPNRTDFWEINDKFPDDFYPATRLASMLNSTFGVWIGPRGGYNYFGSFGRMMDAKGTGEYGNGDICTGSRLYLKNFQKLATDWQQNYGVEYWKWDGFQNRPCSNESHHHMTGGPNNMYYTSDMWEAWTDLFEQVREVNAEQGRGLFINATCYINPSPWLLQWVNTVWLQESGDTGQNGNGARHQNKIYYRDNVYYNLLNNLDLQFPLKNFYNHDPIYGVSDSSSATDEVFREYLYANAMRGTAFWELYFSPSLMNDEKYAIASDVVDWAETNHEVLKNAKLFGARPTQGVYGYSAWNGTQGIVSFTNPLNSKQTYDLVIDSQVGAIPELKDAKGVQVHPFVAGTLDQAISYGDTLHVELEPHQTLIYQFNETDRGTPAILNSRSVGANGLRIRFNQHVAPVSVQVNGVDAKAELLDDQHTVLITSDDLIPENANISWSVKNSAGEVFDGTTSAAVYADGIILNGLPATDDSLIYDASTGLIWLDSPAQETVNQKLDNAGEFTLSTAIETESKNVNLFQAGDAISASVDADGYLQVKVGDATLTSKQTLTHVTEKAHGTFGTDRYVPAATEEEVVGVVADGNEHVISVIRAANGTLKLYVDGEFSDGTYSADLAGKTLSADSMVLYDDNFSGRIKPIELLDYAKTAAEMKTAGQEASDDVLLDRSEWTASSCSEANSGGDQGAAAAIDGDLSTRWHTNYSGNDSHAVDGHWIQVNFGKEESFDTFYYTGRGADINGSIKDYVLELLNEDGSVKETITGTFAADPVRCTVRLDGVKSAWGFKLKPVSTHNGANFAAAVELELSHKATPLTEEELAAKKAALLAEVADLNLQDYTGQSAATMQEWIYKARNAINVSDISWDDIEEGFRAATVLITSDDLIPENANISWSVKNSAGEVFDGTTSAAVYADGIILNGLPATDDSLIYDASTGLIWLDSPAQETVNQKLDNAGEFTLSTAIETESKNVNLFQAGDAISASVDADGYLQVKVGDATLTSKQTLTHVTEKAHGTFGTDRYVPAATEEEVVGVVADGNEHVISVIRAANGTLKLYVDGEFSDGTYSADLAGKTLSADSMVLYDDNFSGRIKPIELLDYAKTAAEMKTAGQEASDDVLLDRSEWTASSCSEANSGGDQGAAAAIDGDLSTRWHTNYSGNDSHAVDGHWIQVNFGKEESFDTFYYTGRGADINGSIKDYVLELLNEDGSVKETITGTFAADPVRCTVRLDGVKSAWGFKLKPVSTHNGANFAAAVELELSHKATPLTEEELAAKKAALLAEVADLNLQDYTGQSAATMQEWIYKARNAINVSDISWDDIEEGFRAAKDALIECKALKAAITEAELLNQDDYTAESWSVLEDALAYAKGAAKKAANAEQVRAAQERLGNAVKALVRAGEEDKVNYTLLEEAVRYAKDQEAAGALEGVNTLVVKEFHEALAEAEGILADRNASQETVNASWLRLTYAIHMLDFKADKEALQTLIAECEAIDLTGVPAGAAKDEFTEALNNAKAVLEDETALQERIDEAYQRLAAARDALPVKVINTDLLRWLISEVEGTNLDDYADVEGTKEAFSAALAKAQSVLDNPKSQDEVDEAAMSLNNAYMALRRKPSEEVLKELQNFTVQVAALNLDLYSPASAKALKTLKIEVDDALKDPALDQKKADDLLKKVNSDSIQNLLKNPDGEKKDDQKKPDVQTPADEQKKPDETKPETSTKPAAEKTETTAKSVKTASALHAGWFSLAAAGAALAGLVVSKKRKK